LAAARAGAGEISLADTAGHGDPQQVRRIFTRLSQELPQVRLSAHFHDTRGNGLANVRAALDAGVRSFDASSHYPGEYWRRLEDEQAYPTEFIRELTQSGFLAALIPEAYGGGGLPLRAAAVILETINHCGCSASQGHAQMYIMGTLLKHGSDAQRAEFLPPIAAGGLRLQAFAVMEPTTGSDTTQLKTRAVRDGDHYTVTGQKVWTSRALHSDLMLLLARTTAVEQCRRRTDGLSVFLVDIRAISARA
jgi:alkylation response protein AidB-like acyl-CoA dehydrogenase